jgi:hypothetical protein
VGAASSPLEGARHRVRAITQPSNADWAAWLWRRRPSPTRATAARFTWTRSAPPRRVRALGARQHTRACRDRLRGPLAWPRAVRLRLRSTTTRARSGALERLGRHRGGASRPPRLTHLNLPGRLRQRDLGRSHRREPCVVGGLDLYQSRDGGATFAKVSDWTNTPAVAPRRSHALVSPPRLSRRNRRLFNGNDGGIYRAANVGRARERHRGLGLRLDNANSGLAVTQFYSGRGRAAAGARVHRRHAGQRLRCSSTSASWRPFRGGDGGFVAVRSRLRPHDVRRLTSSSRSTARPTAASPRSTSAPAFTEAPASERRRRDQYCGAGDHKKANFIAPFILDPNNPGPAPRGANSLWLTENAKAGTPAWRCHGEGALRPRPTTSSTPIRVAREGNANISGSGTTTARSTALANGLAPRQLDARRPRRAAGAARATHHHRPRQSSRAIVAFTGFSPSNVWQTPTAAPPGPRSPATCPRAGLRREAPPAHPSWLYAATSVGSLHERDRRRDVVRPTRARPTSACASSSGSTTTRSAPPPTGAACSRSRVAPGGPANYQDLWWAGSQENGWGMSITQHGLDALRRASIYDAQGQPQVVVLPGAGVEREISPRTRATLHPTAPGSATTTRAASCRARRRQRHAHVPSAQRATSTTPSTASSGQKVDHSASVRARGFHAGRHLRRPAGGAALRRTAGVWRSTSSTARLSRSGTRTDRRPDTVWYVIRAGPGPPPTTLAGTAYRVTELALARRPTTRLHGQPVPAGP